MLDRHPSGAFVIVAVAFAASITAVALILRYALDSQRSRSLQAKPGWRRISDLLRFGTGPFPISIALHLGVLAFLITRVIEPATPPPLMIRLVTVGDGGGGNPAELKAPAIPDAPVTEQAPEEMEMPAPIALPRIPALTTPVHSNDYARTVNQHGLRGMGGGFGGGAGGGAGSGYGRGFGPAYGPFINRLRVSGLDLVLLIDGTGSMRFVMGDVKDRMKALVLAVHRLVPTARIGIVVFRGDGESVAATPFTLSPSQLDLALTSIEAEKGGDWYEDTLAGVKTAVENMAWRPGARKIVILVGDTPPLPEHEAEVLHLIDKFHAEDGTFNTVDVTTEEHERFSRELYFSVHHHYPATIPAAWKFYDQTRHAYQEMAKAGGGEWSSLTKDAEVNQQVLIQAFGRQWQTQTAAVTQAAVQP